MHTFSLINWTSLSENHRSMCVVYIYSCGCVHMWMCGYACINIGFAHVCGNTHTWRPQVSFLIAFHPTFEMRSLSLILKLLDSSRLVSELQEYACVCYPSSYSTGVTDADMPLSMRMLSLRPQVPMLVQQHTLTTKPSHKPLQPSNF